MKRSKIISLILSIVMITGIFPMNIWAEETNETMRTVYLHAQGKNPPLETTNNTTVYVNEDTDIYFAVDNPNKGEYLDDDHEDVVDAKAEAKIKAEEEADRNGLVGTAREAYINYAVSNAAELAKHIEPRYDMNGYRLRICFDPEYFEFVDDADASPIDYTVPDENFKTSETEDVNKGDDNTVLDKENEGGSSIEDVPQSVGYFVYKPTGSGYYTLAGKTYRTAYITVFYSGGYVPQKKDDQHWYNLAKLTLTPIKPGSTDVFIDIDSGDEDYALELFAKNETDELNDQTFDFNAVNGGYHHFLIKDRTKPTPPVANPTSGEYNEKFPLSVELTQDENLTIYYTTNGDEPSDPNSSRQVYKETEPIDITVDTTIKTCAYRSGGQDGAEGKYSNTVSYEYKIIPDRPYLFDSSADKKLLSDRNDISTKCDVYVSDKDVYGRIADGSEVYYTFANLDAKEPVIGDDPETSWVKVEKQNPLVDNQFIHIDRNRTVRLITNKLGRYSEPAVYYFTIKPEEPEANYESGEYDKKIDVTLSTDTEGATIYYTTDGSDPQTNGIVYTDVPITLYKDTTLRAISYFDGGWSDKVSYYYLFSFYDDFGVDAFYPSGVYEGSVNVTLTPNNPDYVVMYHDGDGKWQEYDEIIVVDEDTDIIAKAVEFDTDGNIKAEGSEYVFTYKIKPLPPEFAPESTQFTNANRITVYTPESTEDTTGRFKLYYTLDGSDPTTSKTRILADEKSDSAVIDITKYTVVTAAVWKDDASWSSVVKHSYDIVTLKPVKPLTTLLPGYYTLEIDGEQYSTQFMPVPNNTKIYYTISYDGGLCPDPIPDTEGTFEYNGTAFIPIKGNTVIKAVAVNAFGVKSDVGIFSYTITPEAPKAAPSATIGGSDLPVVPVDAVKGSTVKYTIGGFVNEFPNADDERFYIDTKTGAAYRDKECTQPLGESSANVNSGSVTLEISSTLDGVESDTNRYIYAVSGGDAIAPPYADKETGTYEERKIDSDNNILKVMLYSLNSGGKIQYRIDNKGAWVDYTDGSGVLLKEDAVLQLRYAKGDKYSSVVSYVYNFVPLAPVIELPSGTYLASDNIETKIAYDENIPTDKWYNIFYRRNGDSEDRRYNFSEIEPENLGIDHTMTIKAYVLNEDTGRVSKNTIHYYIIEGGSGASGSVYVAYPYDTDRISAHLLGSGDYAEGIKLLSQNKTADIHYYYEYTKTDGQQVETNVAVYDVTRPIIPTTLMDDITIVAWLEDKNGKIEGSDGRFEIDFVHLRIPTTSLEESGKIEFPKGTKYTIINDYPTDPNIILYYTTDGSDPSDADNKNRIAYSGGELTLNSATTIKTVYFSACGKCKDITDIRDCHNGIYGEIGTYRYTVPTTTGTGGGNYRGGGTTTIDNTRKYTKDIFGNEHPTHIGYINGYPDGSVQPEGDITREEVTAILYRITNHEYEEPFVATGDAFPDVKPGRWSAHDIEYMADKEIVYGYPDGEFKPSRNLSRAEFAALIFRFTEISKTEIENPFTDLNETHWAYNEILALTNSGLIEGYPDKTYKPENNITRAEVMTVVNKLLGRKPLESYVKSLHFNPYNDLYEEKWYYVTVLEATITHNYWLDGAGYECKWEDWK